MGAMKLESLRARESGSACHGENTGRRSFRGNTVAIECMRASTNGEPFSVDIIEIHDGTIQSLRAYVGWRAVMAFVGEGGPRAG